MDVIKPKNCPSCGCETKLVREYLGDFRLNNRIYGVACSNDECNNASPSSWYDDPLDAVAHWNACQPNNNNNETKEN